jgi:tripartite-type tricarboxylate transporter receptor subunit TctC
MHIRTFTLALLLAAANADAAFAQAYPNRPLRVFVPFAAGGAVDALARVVTTKLSETMGQPVLVENRPGAAGNVAAELVAKSPADGYTILQNTNGQVITPSLYSKLNFDPIKDFVPVTQLVDSSLVLVSSLKSELTSARDLVAAAKAKPGKLNYGSTGVGNPLSLTMEMVKSVAGLDIQAIAYRGDAPLHTALAAGEIEIAVVPMGTAIPHIEGGRLNALAVTGATRSPALPNVPTLMEQGIAVDLSSWQGFFVPAGTPRDVVLKIHQETRKALAVPDVVARIKTFGSEPVGSTPDEFARKVDSNLAKYAKVVADAKIPKLD